MRFPFHVLVVESRAPEWREPQQAYPCHGVMENSRGAALPQVSNPIYFISGFFSGKIINQLHLHFKWLLQGKLVHMQKLIPVALPVAGKEPQGF